MCIFISMGRMHVLIGNDALARYRITKYWSLLYGVIKYDLLVPCQRYILIYRMELESACKSILISYVSLKAEVKLLKGIANLYIYKSSLVLLHIMCVPVTFRKLFLKRRTKGNKHENIEHPEVLKY